MDKTINAKRPKPKTILHAECALWAWTAWTCFFGIFETWVGIPELEKMAADEGQGMIEIDPHLVLNIAIAGYAAIGIASIWVTYKIGAGKSWARTSLLWGFILDAVWTAMPPYHGFLEYVSYIPDLALQIYAIYLLYGSTGKEWFKPSALHAAG